MIHHDAQFLVGDLVPVLDSRSEFSPFHQIDSIAYDQSFSPTYPPPLVYGYVVEFVQRGSRFGRFAESISDDQP
jgi:hypothetical protein